MSTDAKGTRYCDECGNGIVKAHKIYHSSEYCGSCYARLFKAVACSRCSASVRVHRNATGDPVCTRCTAAERTCIRCEKSVPRASKIVDGKPVCPSCAPYFTEPAICPHCERESIRLAALPSAGIKEKICQSCRNRHTHATCGVCRKYRKVAHSSPDGEPLCSACFDDPNVTHACPDCGVAVPGSGNSRCRSCANHVALEREISLTCAIFAHDWVATLWRRFGLWLHAKDPHSPKLLSLVRTHQRFFEEIDCAFPAALDLTGVSLLHLFGVQRLRTHLLPTRFIAEQLGVHIADDAKRDAAEHARIADLLALCKRESWGQLMRSYYAALIDGNLSARSVRMYLSTAHSFARYVGLSDSAWAAAQIERYVKANPGSRNNLSRFVSFCRQNQSWDVMMPTKAGQLLPLKDPLKTVLKLSDLLEAVEAAGMESTSTTVLTAILAAALGVTKAMIAKAKPQVFAETGTSISIRLGEEIVILPESLLPYARALMSRRAAGTG
jgi:hypothetical protein